MIVTYHTSLDIHSISANDMVHLIAMFRIISKHSKLCLEITSKYKNIQSHFKQQKYDRSIIPTQFTYTGCIKKN